MYKFAIVEDEKEYQIQLVDFLHRYETENNIQIMPRVFNDGIDILDEYTADYDVIFLDIRMKHKDGMETAKAIREVDENVIIIFITSLAQYAIEGYKVDAMDFILKPVRYEQLNITLNRALLTLSKWKKEKQIILNSKNSICRISSDDIKYVEVTNHDLKFHTVQGVMLQKNSTMRDLENELLPYNFARGSQSFLVNLKYITRIEGDKVLIDDEELYLSRGRKKAFLKAFADYVGSEV